MEPAPASSDERMERSATSRDPQGSENNKKKKVRFDVSPTVDVGSELAVAGTDGTQRGTKRSAEDELLQRYRHEHAQRSHASQRPQSPDVLSNRVSNDAPPRTRTKSGDCTHACRTCRDNFRNLVAHFLQVTLLRFLSRMMCTTCGRKSTLITRTDPELRCGPISTVQMDGKPSESLGDHFSFPTSVDGQIGEVHHMAPVACHPIIKCGTSGCTGSCQPAVVEYGYHAVSIQPRAGFVGRPTRDLAHPCPIHWPPMELRERVTAVKLPLQPCLDIPAWFLRATRRGKSRLLECTVCSQSTREGPITLRASRISPSSLLVHVVPSFLQKKQELYPSCTKVSLCPRWVSSGFCGASIS